MRSEKYPLARPLSCFGFVFLFEKNPRTQRAVRSGLKPSPRELTRLCALSEVAYGKRKEDLRNTETQEHETLGDKMDEGAQVFG